MYRNNKARTKQNARKSCGSTAPATWLATMAARKSASEYPLAPATCPLFNSGGTPKTTRPKTTRPKSTTTTTHDMLSTLAGVCSQSAAKVEKMGLNCVLTLQITGNTKTKETKQVKPVKKAKPAEKKKKETPKKKAASPKKRNSVTAKVSAKKQVVVGKKASKSPQSKKAAVAIEKEYYFSMAVAKKTKSAKK